MIQKGSANGCTDSRGLQRRYVLNHPPSPSQQIYLWRTKCLRRRVAFLSLTLLMFCHSFWWIFHGTLYQPELSDARQWIKPKHMKIISRHTCRKWLQFYARINFHVLFASLSHWKYEYAFNSVRCCWWQPEMRSAFYGPVCHITTQTINLRLMSKRHVCRKLRLSNWLRRQSVWRTVIWHPKHIRQLSFLCWLFRFLFLLSLSFHESFRQCLAPVILRSNRTICFLYSTRFFRCCHQTALLIFKVLH